jgi:hypothetical protein
MGLFSRSKASKPVTYEDIVLLTRAKDIEGLRRAFSLAPDWHNREVIVSALQMIYKDTKADADFQGKALASALKDIIMLCQAETSGGSYRENCLDGSQKLLAYLE